jgi:iron complex outermembrane receptor protein
LDIDWSVASSPVEFNAATPAPTYDTENVTYYELGSKQQFDYGDVGVTLNASAFYYDYDDMVVSSVMTVGSVLSTLNLSTDGVSNLGNMVTFSFNAADASIMGLHIDGGLDFANGYNLDGSVVFLDSELDPGRTIADGRYNVNSTNENNLERDIDGHELPRTPDIQAKVNLSKSHSLEHGVFDWILSAGYKGEYYSTIFNSKLYGATDNLTRERLNGTMGDFWTIDVGFGFEPAALSNVKVEGFISNLTDEHEGSVALITQDSHTRFFNSPRSAGLRVRAKF